MQAIGCVENYFLSPSHVIKNQFKNVLWKNSVLLYNTSWMVQFDLYNTSWMVTKVSKMGIIFDKVYFLGIEMCPGHIKGGVNG